MTIKARKRQQNCISLAHKNLKISQHITLCPETAYYVVFKNKYGTKGGKVMQKFMIVTGTITYAMRARDVLRRKGIEARVEKPPKLKSSMGCGYGVTVSGNIENITQILSDSGVKIISIEVIDL